MRAAKKLEIRQTADSLEMQEHEYKSITAAIQAIEHEHGFKSKEV